MITIGIGGVDVCKMPEALVTYALGSCVGVCLYDSVTKVAGLAHVMLPQSPDGTGNNYKYADIAVPYLVQQMVSKGANKARLTAKIAGGAKMFESTSNTSIGNIGDRNVESVKEQLKKFNIRIVASDTGSNYGRTVYFYPEDGRLEVKTCKGVSHTI